MPKTSFEFKTLEAYGFGVNALCPLGQGQLASGSKDGSIKIWDIATGRCLKTLEHGFGVDALCLC